MLPEASSASAARRRMQSTHCSVSIAGRYSRFPNKGSENRTFLDVRFEAWCIILQSCLYAKFKNPCVFGFRTTRHVAKLSCQMVWVTSILCQEWYTPLPHETASWLIRGVSDARSPPLQKLTPPPTHLLLGVHAFRSSGLSEYPKTREQQKRASWYVFYLMADMHKHITYKL
jgi:hypothetical protein